MLTKTIYILVDCIAIINILFLLKAMKNNSEYYAKWLSYALKTAIVAILANIFVACSFNKISAGISYSLYFSSIDWIIYCLTAFCLVYTNHRRFSKRLAMPTMIIMVIDSVSIFLNLLFDHVFYIFETKDASGVTFYRTGFRPLYYFHLAVDYIPLAFVLFLFIYRMFKSYSMYRIKYIGILSVLIFVIVLNIIYMTAGLLLDASVIFYSVAGTLVYFCISTFVPRSLMSVSVGSATDNMNEGLILFDLNNNCIYANTFSKERFDVDEKTYNFKSEPIATVVNTLRSKGHEYGTHHYINTVSSNGVITEEHYNIRYSELTDKKGRTIGSYFLIEDTTEDVRYLREIQEAKNIADAANSAKSTFLANMSHEIRTPLNSILGLNEMILRTAEDPQIMEYSESIRSSGNALLGIINDILDFSKIEANKMDIRPTDYNPHDLLRECYNYFHQMAEGKDLYYKITCDENMPSVLNGDNNLIRQIMSNLISNAIKYTKTGGVSVNVSCSKSNKKNTDLLINISDTGIGIDSKDIDTLFDSFMRVDEIENYTIQGTGLGLSITKDLIKLMNGNIIVESSPGVGSTFRVSIPQKVKDKTPLGKFRIHDDKKPEHVYRESFHAPTAHILIVDDIKVNLTVIKALLKKTELKIDTASGGDEAIELCKKYRYDVILLDHRMPAPDGIETFVSISSEGLNTLTPVVMLTANALIGMDVEYAELGFSAYLTKPIQSAELEKTLIDLLPAEKVELTEPE